ncbi:LysR family transcriptional regulator [Streptomyces sp. NPDC003035]|uniref:helix-turn-helix domain-containing protein n=1 Tax=Streptomyces sp. NPDC003035 TaxID=3364676 RepID=UPI003693D263
MHPSSGPRFPPYEPAHGGGAAARLHLTQPAVSRTLAALETHRSTLLAWRDASPHPATALPAALAKEIAQESAPEA